MKKIFLYTTLVAAAMSFAACTEDYTDWASPQSNAQEAQQGKVNGTIQAAADAIDLNNVGDNGVNIVKFLGATNATAGSKVKFTELLLNGSVSVPFTTDGNNLFVTTSDLSDAIKSSYASMAYTKRNCTFTVSGDLINAQGTSVLMPITTNEVTIPVTTLNQLPSIAYESAYYYVGGYNGWNIKSPTPMTDNGDGTYSCIIKLNAGEEWFAFAPQSAVDAENWNGLFRSNISGGDTNTTGFFNLDTTSGNSFKLSLDKAATYKFTICPKDWKYYYEPYSESIYYAGDAYGWPADACPMVKNGDDFVGYYYINTPSYGSFKFVVNGAWYGGQDGKLSADGGNISPDHEGFYQIKANTDNMTYSLMQISVLSLIGSAVNGDSSWGTDYDLTWNAEDMAWEGDYTMTDGEYKIRANHDWGISWGGTTDAMTATDGANLSITAGTYHFMFRPACDGQGTLYVEAK